MATRKKLDAEASHAALKPDPRRKPEIPKDAEAMYFDLYDRAPAGYLILSEQGLILEANSTIAALLGLTKDALVKKPLTDFIVPEDRDIYEKHRLQLLGTTAPPVCEFRMRRRDRSPFWAMCAASSWPSAGGVRIIRTVISDITERKRAEEALLAEKERFRTLFLKSPLGIGPIDSEYRFLDVNDTLCLMLGYTRDELLQLTILDITHPDDRPPSHSFWHDVLTGFGPGLQTEKRFVKKDGTVLLAKVTTTAITSPKNSFLYGLGVFEDITALNLAEEKLRNSESNLRALALELSRTEERERRRLALLLHDEIGQSLALVRMNLDGLAGAAESPSGKKDIHQLCALLEKVIDQTRTLTFDLSPPVLQQSGLKAATEWAGEKIGREHGIAFLFSDDGRMTPLDSDVQALLFRGVRELMANVVKHAKARKMTVSLTQREERICLAVEDDGIGFDPSVLEREQNLPGFGLFSIREHLAALGGTFELRSEPGRGTRASLSVPVKKDLPSSRTE